jgi:2-amino-4-hydroxy-6-hydroxymethyldihydropteridine diphosphokinase
VSRACLSLGSNLDPVRHLRIAAAALRERFGEGRVVVSPAYRFPAVGFDGPDFVNAAAVLETDLDPQTLNDWLHALEDANGRDRSGPRYGDRTLDIDIVLFDDRVIDGPLHPGSGPGQVLRVPRDELRHAFVLKPLAEIAPDVVHPLECETLQVLWAAHAEHDVAFEAVALD